MRVLPQGLGKAKPSFLLLLFLVIAIAAQVFAVPADTALTDTDAAKTTDDPSTTSGVRETTTSSTTSKSTSSSTTSTFSSSSSSSSTSTTMDTTTSSSSSSTMSGGSTTTSSVSTTTKSSTSSSTTANGAIVTIPPIANAPYMQESNAPEGTVFIAVGAALGLIGLTLLAWRAMVAWSVNRSVRRAAIIHASESKRLLRGSRKKRSAPYSAAPTVDVSLDKLAAATRASYKPKRVPSTSSGLFFSPTAGGPTGPHHNRNATGSTGNRGSTYLPAGYYAAAGGSNPAPSGEPPYSPTAGLSSPHLSPAGVYHDSRNQRHSYAGGASTSSLNLNQAPQGRAPSAYLEDLFESHAPHSSDSGPR
ncbi:vacuolar membrane protein KLLA0F03465g [Penicillium digitatum]|uniref:Uncharacterized protein n=3 Tax=Penicillium digitatum TaxID=36651 RepID=K9GYU6_PEND2|nr:hypothetical protein PDIP_82500 [Penicillium digitatum Pd1]EKV05570.1 hypothetical protein PDIP_82500 [Penicillium digitatum Pd1]EKV18151.1 hypothetical protein PDIG_10990 [Penicillium digitatum PHI26]KAG0161352.1 hypothetical protein PDIDSM_8886 [Penicillium digitatum]QQK40369.1 vacuolar membrane protein KLLA0F03465g [Penicillium digitatum]